MASTASTPIERHGHSLFVGLSFTKNGERYAADVSRVKKVARGLSVTRVPAAPREAIGIANLKGKVVTILSVPALLGVGCHDSHESSDAFDDSIKDSCGSSETPAGGMPVCAIVFKSDDDESRFGLAVDAFGDLVTIDETQMARPSGADGHSEGKRGLSRHIRVIAECNGMLFRILDIESIVRRFRET